MSAATSDLARLRHWWLRRQGLTPDTAPRTIGACLKQSGWIVTAGSAGVYLAIRGRMRGLSREAVDRAAIDGTDVIEVPGAHARPPLLVPRDEMALALRLHIASFEKHAAPLIASGAISEPAIRAVSAQVCRALDEGPLTTLDLRSRITHPDTAELLIAALVGLSIRGIVRRYPIDGRLDSSRYVYELRDVDDRPDLEAEGDDDTVRRTFVKRYLRWHGPATVDEMIWWNGQTKGPIRKALSAIGAEPVAIAGWTDEAWIAAEDVSAWKSFQADRNDTVLLLPYRDPFVYMRRPPAVLTSRPDVRVLDRQPSPVAFGKVKGLNHHAIVAGGELVGVWGYDPDGGTIAARLWTIDKRLRRRVDDAAAETERFVRDELGDLKRSAVDPPKERARRIRFCRAESSTGSEGSRGSRASRGSKR